MGKSTLALNILEKYPDAKILADDVSFIDSDSLLIPFLRGIDMYPYLPINRIYLTRNEFLKRKLSSILFNLFPNRKVIEKLIRRFFLPRINFARFMESNYLKNRFEIENIFLLTVIKNENDFQQFDNTEIIETQFLANSSFYEIKEYHDILEVVISTFPNSNFKKLFLSKNAYTEQVEFITNNVQNRVISLPSDYSNIYNTIGEVFS